MSLHAGKKVFETAIRPALTYSCSTSYTLVGVKGHRKGIARKLHSIQGQFLRKIIGAYRATAIEAIEIEANVLPIDLHLDCLIAKTVRRLSTALVQEMITAIDRIKRQIKGRRGRASRVRPTPAKRLQDWNLGIERRQTGPRPASLRRLACEEWACR